MHQENIVADGSHPVPIDLETILQSSNEDQKHSESEDAAFNAATAKLANSVMATGLLPAYGRGPDGKVFAMGGVTADWNTKIRIKWENINSNDMRPTALERGRHRQSQPAARERDLREILGSHRGPDCGL
jgi:lantibiotic modifying enzyme